MAKKNARTNFGKVVAEARQKQNLTQIELAERAGLTQQFVNSVEKKAGNNIRFCNAIKLCRALGLSLDKTARVILSRK